VTVKAENSGKQLPMGWCAAAVAGIVILMALRPGDSTFVVDEPSLLALAQYWNHLPSQILGVDFSFSLARVSLMGSHGLYYGPAAVWMYQIFEAFTMDPIALTAMHAVLFGAMTGIALLWLSRSLKVTPVLAVVTILSPWLWFYFRQLWDNSFCIPLSAVAFAGYADFLVTRRRWTLWLGVLAGALMPLVHFMALALVMPLAIHFVLFQTRWVRKFGLGVVLVFVAVNVVGWTYWSYLLDHHETAGGPAFMPDSASLGWVFPLSGGQLLSGAGLSKILGEEWLYTLAMPLPFVVTAALTISVFVYAAVWVGMLLAVGRCWRVIRDGAQASATDQMALVALMVFIGQAILDGVGHVYGQPHYFNATWIAYAVFAWMAIDAMQRRFPKSILVRAALPVYGASLAILIAAAGYKIARDGGTRSLHYGTVLSEQVAAAAKMKSFDAASRVIYAFPQWLNYPDAPQNLEWWVEASGPPGGKRRIVVKYRDAFPTDARIIVDDSPM
jgi:hypothetical protein